MRKKCGTKDRVTRIVLGALIGAAYVMGYIQGTAALVLGVISLIMIGTGAVGYCAIYKPMEIDTREEKS